MPDLAKLRELYAWMREEKILYARCGELELRLEPAPAPRASLADVSDPSPESDEDAARRALAELLYSTSAEVDPLFDMLQRKQQPAVDA